MFFLKNAVFHQMFFFKMPFSTVFGRPQDYKAKG